MTPTPAGEMRQRVTIQRQVAANSSFGKTTGNWQSIASRWAKVKPTRAYTKLIAKEEGSETDFIVNMRFTTLLQEGDRLNFDGQPLYITGTIDIESRGIELEISCSERPVPVA